MQAAQDYCNRQAIRSDIDTQKTVASALLIMKSPVDKENTVPGQTPTNGSSLRELSSHCKGPNVCLESVHVQGNSPKRIKLIS